MALALSPHYFGQSSNQVAPEATAGARRALALDPSIAEAHVALGVVAGRRLEWANAETEIKMALALDAHDLEARIQYARLLLVRGRLDEAMRELEKARADEPASAMVLSMLTCAWYMRGQFDRALVESDRALLSDSMNLINAIYRPMILASMTPSRRAEARTILKRIHVNHPVALYAMAFVGETASVRARLDTLAKGGTNRWPETARAYGMLGLKDTSQALDALERATTVKEPWLFMGGGLGDPMFDGVRESSRFRALLTRVGLGAK